MTVLQERERERDRGIEMKEVAYTPNQTGYGLCSLVEMIAQASPKDRLSEPPMARANAWRIWTALCPDQSFDWPPLFQGKTSQQAVGGALPMASQIPHVQGALVPECTVPSPFCSASVLKCVRRSDPRGSIPVSGPLVLSALHPNTDVIGFEVDLIVLQGSVHKSAPLY